MTDIVDLNVVLAAILPEDALKERVERHLRRHDRLSVPFSVGIELLLVAERWGLPRVAAVGAVLERFDLENSAILLTAAEALDTREVPTVFDAVHLADALHRGGRLHTADARLAQTPFPVVKV